MENINQFDFGGYVTRHGLRCSDNRVIMPDAFKHNDGKKVPLMWGHQHQDVFHVLGHAILENRADGVYGYCKFNNTESGQTAKEAVEHGDIVALSIYANQLRQQGNNVMHGEIREVSLVMAGANPGAYIDSVIKHEDGDDCEAKIYANGGDGLDILSHASPDYQIDEKDEVVKEETSVEHEEKKDKTIKEILDTLNEEQQTAVYALIGEALGVDETDEDDEKNEEDNNMKHNAFENENETMQGAVLTHADQRAILDLAKTRRVGTLQHAIQEYMESNEELAHGFVNEEGTDAVESLFPEYKNIQTGAPETLQRDKGWVGVFMKGVHKSPVSRIRTRAADARAAAITAKGHKKGVEKAKMGNIKLLGRTTDPQTVFVKDEMHRDDILDITEFDVVSYLRGIMRDALEEKLALCAMIGDGLEDGDADKVSEEHIRPIWTDDDIYTIHQKVDLAAMKTELQGTNTAANFGENFIYAEAVIQAALYGRENYKGSGNMEFFCDPHLLNVMMLARDMNGRRIYGTKAELTSALNARAIHTAEQFTGKVRTAKDGKKYKLLGIFVNLDDYHFGATKGGEITHFNQFDIDFNQEKYLAEARVSGALTKPYSAIVLEMEVAE